MFMFCFFYHAKPSKVAEFIISSGEAKKGTIKGQTTLGSLIAIDHSGY